MIANDDELRATQQRIARFQEQLAALRRTEANRENHRMAGSGYVAEVDRMQLEVRQYLTLHPSELVGSGAV
jgi:hypothetical protein